MVKSSSKVKLEPDKSQPSLFGFFKKAPVAPVAASTPRPAIVKAEPSSSKGATTSEPISLISSDVEDSFTHSKKTTGTSTATTPLSANELDRMDLNMDEEDSETAEPQVGGKRKKLRAIVQDSEDEEQVPAIMVKKPRLSKAVDDDDEAFIAPEDSELADSDHAMDEDESPAPKKASKKLDSKTSLSHDKNKTYEAPTKQVLDKRAKIALALNKSRSQLEADKKKANEQMFSFLRDVKDADGNAPGSPDYDGRTLYIPPAAFKQMTPFEKQFWEIKRNHYNVILFFQKGKFYELYEDDARIGHQEFDLKLTDRVKMAMVGVPESQFELWASKFLAKGYKVGRVDQSETALGAEMRKAADKGKGKASGGKDDKLVGRSLKAVYTSGTLVEGMTEDMGKHCVCIKETLNEDRMPVFGFAILDAATAEFNLIGFEDDASRTKLETLFRQLRPQELVQEKGKLSGATKRVLKAILPEDCRQTDLRANSEYPSFDASLSLVEEKCGSFDTNGMNIDDNRTIAHQTLLDFKGNENVISALGGLLAYLKTLNLDDDLTKVSNFNKYELHGNSETRKMILDGQSLAHIEVLQNSLGTEEGTLLRLMNRCVTPSGKRLFKLWLCQPLCDAGSINARLDAVEDIMGNSVFQEQFIKMSKGMVDLERVLSRIHAGSCKPVIFKKALANLMALDNLFATLQGHQEDLKSTLLIEMLAKAPKLEKKVKTVERSFVEEDNMLLPLDGADDEYDENTKAIGEAEEALEDLLSECKEEIGCSELKFKDVGTKDIYQIEVPVDKTKKVPDKWRKMSGTQKVHRFYFPKLEKLIRTLKEARETNGMLRAAFQGKLYASFSKDYHLYLSAVKLLAELDCLVSLARTSSSLGEPSCRPVIVDQPNAFCDFQELRHPCLLSSNVDFIPNNVKLGATNESKCESLMLLTGPNMSGKSTLLRMTAAAMIMAQCGCFVPAERAVLSPVDRICTRMGANDMIFSNASTFKVEMDDCKKILTEATPKSFVILDELGRGTSSHDGTSIAFAVLHHLATYKSCIGYFSTHYNTLAKDFEPHSNVRNCHMSAIINGREITFLYKLTDGATLKSYGPMVARLAGIPDSIVERATRISNQYAHEAETKENNTRVHEVDVPLSLQQDASWLAKITTEAIAPLDDYQFLQTLKVISQNIKALDEATIGAADVSI